MSSRYTKLIDYGRGNDLPEVIQREQFMKNLLTRGSAHSPAPEKVSAAEFSASMQEEPDNNMTEDPLQNPEPEAKTRPVFAPESLRMEKSRNKYHLVLHHKDFVLKFTTSMFSVSDYTVGFIMDKNVFLFEPKLQGEYEIVCLPDRESVYKVLYAGGILDMKDGHGSTLLMFMRVEE